MSPNSGDGREGTAVSRNASSHRIKEVVGSQGCGLLWAIDEVLHGESSFRDLDSHGQFALFCVRLLRAAARAESEMKMPKERSQATLKVSLPGSFHMKRTISTPNKIETEPSIASAGCIAALVSNSQAAIIDACRANGKRLDWETTKRNRLPLWIRSEDLLRKIAEEVGQSIYKKHRNIMECALFFIAAGNMHLLRNLAATDQSASGRKFLKFITDFDFSSERGRKAAKRRAPSVF